MIQKVLIGLHFLLIPFAVFSGEGDEARYFNDRAQGWFWYQDPPSDEKEEPKDEEVMAPLMSQDPQAVLKAYQQRIEDAKALAVMQPTQANVQRYIAVQKEAYDRSALFADTWRRVVWTTPELDYSISHPTNSVGLAVSREQDRAAKARAVSALAQTDGLFFFFSSTCEHCHAQAPILARFSHRYGLKVLAISLDGGDLPDFPGALPDNGMAARLGVTMTPAIFMVNPMSGEIAPVGYGVMTESELLQRIYTLTMAQRGEF
jgi:conjugal transfer pilus assembly protein TraF